jgi:type II secretory pathway pseudopilin PulG
MGWGTIMRMQRLHGFTYIGLLVAVVLIGIGLAAAGQVWNTTAKRERERELLFVGTQFRQAIGSYFEASPGVKQYPRKLEELLQDQRFPVVKRHLRKIYLDPITGSRDWGLVTVGDQIVGVYSRSEDKPLKIENFAPEDSAFAGTAAYSDWRFVYAPATAAAAEPAAAANSAQASPAGNQPIAAPPAR